MRHLSIWILLTLSVFVLGSWAMSDTSAYDLSEDADSDVQDALSNDNGRGKGKRLKLTKEEGNAKREERKEKKLEKLRKTAEIKGKFPRQKVYLMWEQYLIQLDLEDNLDFSEPDQYKDGFVEYLDDWAVKNNFNGTIVKQTADRLWTKEFRGKNKKDNWFSKILLWSLKGECSAGSLTDEEQSLSVALRAWGEVDVQKDPQDARLKALTKIMALAKTAGLMNDDGKLCLCI